MNRRHFVGTVAGAAFAQAARPFDLLIRDGTVYDPASWTLLAIEDGEFPLTDSQKNTGTAQQRVVSKLAICRGKRVV